MIRHTSSGPPREGIVFVLVVSLLALFAVVGLSFVIYSESSATGSRIVKEAQTVVDDSAQIEPELILNRILGALIYDHPDDQTGVYSALRGHSLARNMYGSRELLTQYYDPSAGQWRRIRDPFVIDPKTGTNMEININ